MESLALKYRPKEFKDLVGQNNIKTVLTNQLKTGEVKQAYLFIGSAGTGKTTSARIFGNEINEGKGNLIEIDGASNNGVDNIRNLIEDCKMKSLDSKYKVYIIDEVHMLSIGAFNALLKVLEEPPNGVIFILCTTDVHKIPATILSRCQRFDFQRIPADKIYVRLEQIIDLENKDGNKIISDSESLYYIAELAAGGMRDAITKLDTVLGYSKDITTDTVLKCLGITSYDDMTDLLIAIIDRQSKECIEIINDVYMSGKDLKLFIKDTAKYILDIIKYALTKDFSLTAIPNNNHINAEEIAGTVATSYLLELLDTFNKLYQVVKYEQNPIALIEGEVLLACLK